LGALTRHMSEKWSPSRVERRVVRLAAEQEGVISTAQLHALRADKDWIHKRVAMGWLVRVLRGVYAIGHPPRTRRGWYAAALLAGGERSVLSHTTAAAVHRMIAATGQLHLTVPRSFHGIEGIRIHRPRTLRADDIAIVEGLRVTSPARTLIDLADFRRRRLLEQAIDQAEYHQLHLPLGEVHDRLHRRPRSRLLRSVITDHVAGSTITESEAEELFLALVWRAALPRPELQVTLWGRRRDFLFREQRVVVEIDGRQAHDRDGAFERDALRDAEVVINRHRPLRFTRRAVKFDRAYVELALRAVLTGAY
jgi:very-short-patch-repair endonuclease